MTDQNLTAVFYNQRDIRLQDFEIPEPGTGQVQVRMENVAICGSDITLWEHNGIPGMSEVKAPFAIGHECSGVISKLGEGVTSLKVGPIGLLTLMAAKVFGALSVCVTEIMENRIEMAKKLGADYTLNVKSMGPNEVAETVEKFFGEKPNVAVECSGDASSMQTAVFATRSGGRFVQVGLGAATVSIPIVNATIREVDIVGIMSDTYCIPLALEMVASGQIDVKPVITHRFNLENVVEAFELAESRTVGKVLIKCGKN